MSLAGNAFTILAATQLGTLAIVFAMIFAITSRDIGFAAGYAASVTAGASGLYAVDAAGLASV